MTPPLELTPIIQAWRGFTKFDIRAQRYARNLEREIFKLLRDAQADIQAQIARINPSNPRHARHRLGRLQKLDQAITQALNDGFANIESLSAKELREFVRISSTNAQQVVNRAVETEIISVPLNRAVLGAIAKDTMIEGEFIPAWWKAARNSLKADSIRQIRLGVIQGESINQIVKRLTPVNQRSLRHARTLVRTSVNAINNSARIATLAANDDVIAGFQWSSTLDSRTSIHCISRDRLRWTTDFKPINHNIPFDGGPPAHWGCRSSVISFFKDSPKLPPRVRASIKGPLPAETSFKEFMRSLSPDELSELSIGKRRVELLLSGKITAKDLLSSSGNPLTLAQLEG